MGVKVEIPERSCDPKFSEACLAILSNQDIVLGIVSYQCIESLISSLCIPA